MLKTARFPLLGYGVALFCVAAAVLIRLLLHPLTGDRFFFLPFYAAVILGSWFGGVMPGLLATTLSLLAINYFWFESFDFLSRAHWADGVGFLLMCLMITLINGALRRAERRIEEGAAALQETEEGYRRIVETASEGIRMVDAEGRTTYANHRVAEILGCAVEDMVDRPSLDFIFDEDLAEAVRRFERVKLGASERSDFRLRRKDGSEIWTHISTSPIYDKDGTFLGALDMLTDNAERKRAEDSVKLLAEQQEIIVRLGRHALSGGDIPTLLSDATSLVAKSLECEFCQVFELLPDGKSLVLRAGAGWEEGLAGKVTVGAGVDSQEGYTLLSNEPVIVADLRNEKRFSAPSVYLEHGIISGMSVTIQAKDRPLGVLSAYTGRQRIFSKEEINFLQAVAKILASVVERIRSEDALRESERRYSTLAEAIPGIFLTKRPDGTCDYANQRFLEYTGTAPEAALGFGWASALHPEDVEHVAAKWMESVKRGKIFESEYRLRRADGAYRWFRARSLPMRDEQGNIVKWFAFCTDIDDEKQAHQERSQLLAREQEARAAAAAANAAKDEFLAKLSHELRTPLHSIMGWTRLLRKGRLGDKASAHVLQIIERNAHWQAQLVEDLFDISGMITGKLRLDLQPVELLPIISAAIESIRPAADAKAIQIKALLDPDVKPVSADPDRLQQVVWNLLSNAVKFTPAGRHIEVLLNKDPSHARVTVSDTGIGISADFLPHIFDRFRQVDATSIRRPEGLGLGLAIARHIVELHGGTIHAESSGEGKGAVFTVRLPFAAIADNTQQTTHPDTRAG